MPARRTLLFLLLIVLTGFVIRLGYLLEVTSQPGYRWADPDSYERKARELAGGDDGWRWSFDAVRHTVDGRDYSLPPLYPALLSAFALLPGFPRNAQVGQVLLSSLSIVLVFFLARSVHSKRAGLLAAAIYALWLPNIIAVWSTMQETLYVPLVLLAFALLVRAIEGDFGLTASYSAGLAFGLAALTRSIPLYFMPLAALFSWRPKKIVGLALGFATFTVPYSVALSYHLGEVTFIENHGGIRVVERYGGYDEGEPPGTLETGFIVARALVSSPGEILSDWWSTTRAVLHVNGGRLLQIYLGAQTKIGARVSKLASIVLADSTFIVSLLLAPLGLALCRRPRLAWVLAGWIGLNLALTMVSGFGGARLRAPFEPLLVVLAAVVIAGDYRVGRRFELPLALFVSLALAAIVLPQIPSSLRARGDYGVYWPLDALPKRAPMVGEAGFNVLAVADSVEFVMRPRNATGQTRIEVSLEGEVMEPVVVRNREHRFRYAWPSFGLVYVELVARDVLTGQPVRALVIVPAR